MSEATSATRRPRLHCRTRSRCGEIVGRDPCRAFQFHYPPADPLLADQICDRPADILRRDHGESLVSRLEEAAQHAFVASRGDVLGRILHEPAGPQEGDGKIELAKGFFQHRPLAQQIVHLSVGAEGGEADNPLRAGSE